MSYHRSDQSRNRPYVQSKYSDYKPSYSDRDYGRETNDLLVQISGPDRHFRADPSSIARSCFQCPGLLDANKQLRLILGIKANGASELLAPEHLFPENLATRLSYNRKRLPSAEDDTLAFKSLSPLVFRDISGLKDVLSDHMNRKNGRASKANKAYEGYAISSVSKETLRYHYENLRTIICHMISTLPYADALYGISTPPEGRTIFSEFLLFTCNDYKFGHVEGFLDSAWGVVDCDQLKQNSRELDRIKPHVEQDINVREEMFNVGKVRKPCRHAETFEVIGLEDERIALRQHLQACYKRASGPVCVVLHGWSKAKVALKVMGIDTSNWSTNLRSAMRGKIGSYDRKPKRDRSRSRSPRRNTADSSGQIKQERGREDNNPRMKRDNSSSGTLDPRELEVYVVDTQVLYSTVRKSGNLVTGLLSACQDFGLPVDDVAQNEYSAGNEIHYLWDLFIKMADGATIDDMYRTQFKDKHTDRRNAEDDEDDEDEEELPERSLASKRIPPRDPYEDLHNDEYDDDSD